MKQELTNTDQLPRYDRSYKSFHYYLKQASRVEGQTAIIIVLTLSEACRKAANGASPGRLRIYSHLKVEPVYWDRGRERCNDTILLSPRVRVRLQKINKELDSIKCAIDSTDKILAEYGLYLSADAVREAIDNRTNGDYGPNQTNRTNRDYGPKINNRTNGTNANANANANDSGQIVNREQNLQGNGDNNSDEELKANTLPDSPVEILRKTARLECVGKGVQLGAEATRTAYLEACHRIEMFVRDRQFHLTDLNGFDRDFFEGFRNWLLEYRFLKNGVRQGYTASTISLTLGIIRNLLRKADNDGYEVNGYYKTMAINIAGSTGSEKIYLTENELSNLARVYVCSEAERNIRDMFILSSYTALRISDINRLDKAEISDSTIKLYQKKTGGYVQIPILKEVSALIKSYKERPEGFPKLSNSYANKLIKRLAERAGLNSKTSVRICRGGQTQVSMESKSSLISFHTARRSCITNLFLRGYSINHLMGLSGHSSIQSFQRYVRSSSDDVTKEFMKELKRRGDI